MIAVFLTVYTVRISYQMYGKGTAWEWGIYKNGTGVTFRVRVLFSPWVCGLFRINIPYPRGNNDTNQEILVLMAAAWRAAIVTMSRSVCVCVCIYMVQCGILHHR